MLANVAELGASRMEEMIGKASLRDNWRYQVVTRLLIWGLRRVSKRSNKTLKSEPMFHGRFLRS